MAKDVGTAICKSIVVLFLPCLDAFFGIPSLHASSFFEMFFCDFYHANSYFDHSVAPIMNIHKPVMPKNACLL